MLSLPTCCGTAIPTLQCLNDKCRKEVGVKEALPSGTQVERASQVQQTNYAINVLFVPAFIASGDGGVDRHPFALDAPFLYASNEEITSIGRVRGHYNSTH